MVSRLFRWSKAVAAKRYKKDFLRLMAAVPGRFAIIRKSRQTIKRQPENHIMNKYRWSLVISAVVVILLAGGWSYMIYGRISSTLQDQTKQGVAATVKAQEPHYVTLADLENKDPKHAAQSFNALWQAIESPQYVRMKVWHPDYTVVWSNLQELIGQKFPPFDELTDASHGEVTFDMESQKNENIGERNYDVLGETYVPFAGPDGKVVGIIEVYNIPTAYDRELNQEFLRSLVMVVGSAIVLYLVLAFVFARLFKEEKSAPAA